MRQLFTGCIIIRSGTYPAPFKISVSYGGEPMTTCPNCHTQLNPGDDICENCGAVISTLKPMPAFPKTIPSTPISASSLTPAIPDASVATAAPSQNSSSCPNCKAALFPGSDICEQCGMVLSI